MTHLHIEVDHSFMYIFVTMCVLINVCDLLSSEKSQGMGMTNLVFSSVVLSF